MRILNLEGGDLSRAARSRLERLGTVDDADPTQAELASLIPGYDVVVMRFRQRLTADVIARANKLRYVVCPTTGLDHIELDALSGRGVQLISLYGQHEFLRGVWASAEHTWALLLALIRKLPTAVRAPVDGIWTQHPYFGTELAGKRLGLVGLGRIGEKVARYGIAFNMTVKAYDPAPTGDTSGVEMTASLDELLAATDVLSIHVPLNENTRGLIGKHELGLLPQGAILVNTARGAILEEAALLQALDDGRLSGAALDVLAGEGSDGFPAQHPLVAYARHHNNIVLTPHIAGATWESRELTELHVVDRLVQSVRRRE